MISHSLYPLRYRYVVGNISLLGKTKVANSAHIAHCNLFLQENISPSEKKKLLTLRDIYIQCDLVYIPEEF